MAVATPDYTRRQLYALRCELIFRLDEAYANLSGHETSVYFGSEKPKWLDPARASQNKGMPEWFLLLLRSADNPLPDRVIVIGVLYGGLRLIEPFGDLCAGLEIETQDPNGGGDPEEDLRLSMSYYFDRNGGSQLPCANVLTQLIRGACNGTQRFHIPLRALVGRIDQVGHFSHHSEAVRAFLQLKAVVAAIMVIGGVPPCRIKLEPRSAADSSVRRLFCRGRRRAPNGASTSSGTSAGGGR